MLLVRVPDAVLGALRYSPSHCVIGVDVCRRSPISVILPVNTTTSQRLAGCAGDRRNRRDGHVTGLVCGVSPRGPGISPGRPATEQDRQALTAAPGIAPIWTQAIRPTKGGTSPGKANLQYERESDLFTPESRAQMSAQDRKRREHLTMEIRRAESRDAMAIATVHVRSWKVAYPGQIPQGYLDSLHPEDRVEGWQQVLSATDWPREGVFLLVDESGASGVDPRSSEVGPGASEAEPEGGEVVGFSHICPTATTISTLRRSARSRRSTCP